MAQIYRKKSGTQESGYALLSSLIMLFVLATVAIGFFYSTMSERSNSSTDMQKNTAYYAAEAGMEKMTSDLGTLYQNQKSPRIADITNLTTGAYWPSVTDSQYQLYNIQVAADPKIPTMPASVVANISSGPNAGLVAQIVKMQLQATAQTRGAISGQGSIVGMAQVRMTRDIEVALIPVFQFGIFSDSDLDFFNGPPFNFGGRVFTNGNLFLATGNGLTFTSKVQAVKEVVRDRLENGQDATGNWNGVVDIPTSPNGCSGAQPACRALGMTEESVTNFFNPPPLSNPNWTNISTTKYGGMLQNGKTGVKPLILPFVGQGVGPYEIIRRPYPSTELPSSSTGTSRLYNQAQIRILLDDNPANLPGGLQAGDRQLDFYPANPSAVGALTPTLGPAAVAGVQSMAQGIQLQLTKGPGNCVDSKSNPIPCVGWDTAWVNRTIPPQAAVGTPWPLISGWLRVEYRDTNGAYHNVTQEWLNLGFARQAQAGGPTPNAEAGIANTVHPNAILLLQSPSDPARYAPSAPQYGWYPINMYDPREGEVRDNAAGADCAVGGLMNVIELDMDNLRRWLSGGIGASGTSVESQTQNGYIVYYSDRRGMQLDPLAAPAELLGEYGFNDMVNIQDPVGSPNGKLDTGEDVNQDGRLRTYGAATIGIGFGLPAAASTNPYTGPGRIANCATTGRVNQVTGPRHVIRAVNGSLGHIPLTPAGTGGTTIASENPVYVLGNYNANNAAGFGSTNEAASAVIADAVTLLSQAYTDLRGLQNPTNLGGRPAATTSYRLAVAAGKNPAFPSPIVAGAGWGPANTDFGTDGGVHNFLRYIEAWGGQNLNYRGSLVSFYYAHQAVGAFKCCTVVYSPPARNYSFDQLFLNPSNMPPGTPRFQDIDNLGYHQDFRSQ
jgi:Tfp pilus assembly protein PilX